MYEKRSSNYMVQYNIIAASTDRLNNYGDIFSQMTSVRC